MDINRIDEPLATLAPLFFYHYLFSCPSLDFFFPPRIQTRRLAHSSAAVPRPASEQLRDVLASAATARGRRWGAGGRHPIRQQLRHTYR